MISSMELLDELLEGCERPEDLLGDTGLMKELKIKLMERMLVAELTAHLGYEEGKDAPPGQPNRRNGTASKRLKGRYGEIFQSRNGPHTNRCPSAMASSFRAMSKFNPNAVIGC
jgi:hypothetical protein